MPVLASVSAPVNSERPAGQLGRDQPAASPQREQLGLREGFGPQPLRIGRRVGACRCAGAGRRRDLLDEPDVDEHVPADHVGGSVEDLPLERQLGRVVQPEPRGEAAVGPAGLHHLGRPVVRRARSRVRHDVVRLEQLHERDRDPQDALGRLAVVIGGQVGLAARRGPGVEGLGHRLTAADMPDVRDQDAPAAALAPPGDHFFALVGGHDRRLSRLGQQPDGQNRLRPPSRHRRPASQSRGLRSRGPRSPRGPPRRRHSAPGCPPGHCTRRPGTRARPSPARPPAAAATGRHARDYESRDYEPRDGGSRDRGRGGLPGRSG